MKRTSLSRRTRLRRGGALPRRGRARFRSYVPDKAYQDFVRSHRCLLAGHPKHICGRAEFAHVGSRGAGHHDRGEGVPLCGMAHRRSPLSLHNKSTGDFETIWGLKPGTLRATATRLLADYTERGERERGAGIRRDGRR